MAKNGPAPLRCAIYTRKSTEEGLEKDFNSLDAQREACAAYVTSQRHEGWALLPDLYDDGGFSGGTMERPALQKLLDDVRAGRIDIVVVYKVDRLTRSLSDFARIVDVLDEADCSFVSVTQAFNTTNSMGRLTLNVLLSFAQFEREVIAERIRDKVAASKARGMWMGGGVPLGYEAKDRKLIIEPEEAATVRYIMERYLASRSVRELLIELERAGIVSKRRTTRDGSVRGGIPFRRGALYWLLSNRIYLGEIVHKGTAYPGEHEANVSQDLFDAVQARLAQRSSYTSDTSPRRIVSLLAGMIHDHEGRPMSPCHTRNHGKRYRYYASNKGDGSTTSALRLPAEELEAAVRKSLSDFLLDPTQMRGAGSTLNAEQLVPFTSHRVALGNQVASMPVAELHTLLKQLEFRLEVRPDGVAASFSNAKLICMAGIETDRDSRIDLAIPTTIQAYGHETRLRLDPPAGTPTRKDEKLLQLVARAFGARDQLLDMSEADVKTMPIRQRRHINRVARLAYLDPAIIRSILDGTQPSHIAARELWRTSKLPMSWIEQREVLRFDPA